MERVTPEVLFNIEHPCAGTNAGGVLIFLDLSSPGARTVAIRGNLLLLQHDLIAFFEAAKNLGDGSV